MKRLAAFLALTAIVVTTMTLVQEAGHDRQFRDLLASGEQALSHGQSYQAIEFFSGALALRPAAMVAYFRRGEAYRDQRQDDRAIRDYLEASRLSPTASEPLVALGELYDQQGDPATAAEWYRQANERLKDTDPDLLYALALALYRAGTPAAAREPLRRALARDDASAEGHYLLGLVSRDVQDADGAIVSLERAVRIAPWLVAAREELADMYRERGREADELAQLRALAGMDHSVDRRVAVGLAEARRGRYDTALESLGAVETIAPNDSRVALAIGRVLLGRAERSRDRRLAGEARAALERALGGTARRSEGLALFGRALYLSGDIAGAERILQEAIETSPIDAEAFDFYADTAEAAGHPQAARDALLDLCALLGDTAPRAERTLRLRRIGALSLDAGDPRTAVTFLAQALEGDARDAVSLGLMARARWQTGDAEGAKLALHEALALDASDATLQRLTRTIK